MKLNGSKSSVSRAIMSVVPFIFIAAAIVCMTLWLFETVIASSSLYGLLTKGSAYAGDVQYADLADIADELYKQNEGDGFYTPQDFPVIAYGTTWATLTAESASVTDAPVVFGDTPRILLRNIGQLTNSRFPGQNGKCVLSAHCRGIFEKLETLQVGDEIKLTTVYGDYVYTVTETVIIGQADEKWLEPEDGKDVLYVYTCYPSVSVVRRTQRFLVIAEKTSGKNWMGGLTE